MRKGGEGHKMGQTSTHKVKEGRGATSRRKSSGFLHVLHLYCEPLRRTQYGADHKARRSHDTKGHAVLPGRSGHPCRLSLNRNSVQIEVYTKSQLQNKQTKKWLSCLEKNKSSCSTEAVKICKQHAQAKIHYKCIY